jgi:hypothetical protein
MAHSSALLVEEDGDTHQALVPLLSKMPNAQTPKTPKRGVARNDADTGWPDANTRDGFCRTIPNHIQRKQVHPRHFLPICEMANLRATPVAHSVGSHQSLDRACGAELLGTKVHPDGQCKGVYWKEDEKLLPSIWR